MPLYSYECSCGEKFDELRPMKHRKTSPCPKCGVTAKQVITTVAFDPRMGLDPGFPTAVDRFDRVHRQAAKEEAKRALS